MDTITFLGLEMEVPPFFDWSVGKPIYCQDGGYWHVGGHGISNDHIWRLGVSHIVREERPWRFVPHPEHDGRVFPDEASMTAYKLKHGLIHPYKPKVASLA